MIVLEENKLVETFFGFIENPKDGLILFQAVKDGVLPSIQRRLSVEQRIQIKSGSVFVFNETESNIRRWTDGRNWTPSRVQGDFLIYRELEKNMDKAKRDKKSLKNSKRSLSLKSLDAKKALSSRYESLNIPTFRPDKFLIKLDGLIKKTMSVVIKGQTYHMISYYKETDVLDNKLSTPSEVKSLKKVVISDELLHQLKQPTQKAPGIEEIKKLKNLNSLPNITNSSVNMSGKDIINKSNEINKQSFMNISTTKDNSVNVGNPNNLTNNDNLDSDKINKSKENIKSNIDNSKSKGKNIEEMISQIDDNLHFLQISKNNPQILNHLQMNPELLHHVTQLLNEKENNANNIKLENIHEDHNILNHNIKNIKNNISPITNHSLLNPNEASTSQPTLSLLNNQTHESAIQYSNMENQHQNLNIESLYHQLDNKLHHPNENEKEEIHSNEELLNLFLQFAEKEKLHLDNDINEKEYTTTLNHELLHHANPELLNYFNGSLHGLHEILAQEKSINHHVLNDTSTVAAGATVHHDTDINLLANENIHHYSNNQELIEYLMHLDNQQKLSQNDLNNALLNNENIEAVQHNLNNNHHMTSVATSTDNHTDHSEHINHDVQTTLEHSLNIDPSQEHNTNRSVLTLNDKLNQEQKITTEPINKDSTENLNGNSEFNPTQNSIEINMSHILQFLNSSQDLDMETLQNLLQYANHEQNSELAHYLETIIHMLVMEQQQHHIGETQPMESEHSLSILNNNENQNQNQNQDHNHQNQNQNLNQNQNHNPNNQIHSDFLSSTHNDMSNQNFLNYLHLNNLSNTLLDNNHLTENSLYTHLTHSNNVSQPLPVSNIHTSTMNTITSLPSSIPQELIHALATESTTTHHPSFTNNYSIYHGHEDEDHMDHDHIDEKMDHEPLIPIQTTVSFS